MNRRLLWGLAAIPGALAGHALVYALTGQAQSDGHHGYFVPALQYSVVLLAGICSVLLVRALSAVARVKTEEVCLHNVWIRLAIAQVLFYTAIESLEGYSISPTAILTQIFVAFLVALVLVQFSRLLLGAERCAREGSRYLERLRAGSPLHRFFAERSPAHALRIAGGSARFGRPPPHR
ncbi:MAG: hypothetical protein ABR584_01915 [Candidatus Baltobacteraceae bacterium]